MEALEVWENKGERLKIYCDPEPQDHRDFDNLGIMLCAHGRYILGDEQFNDRESLDQRLEELDPVVKLPLWLLDHSGLAMQTGSFASDAQQWDSGQVGWIVATKKDILNCFTGYDKDGKREPMRQLLSPRMIKDAERILRGEVDTYSKHIGGQVYGYTIEKKSTCDKCGKDSSENIDSCWGFYETDQIWDEVGKKDWVQMK
tara:strand:+ start:21 stop:623 length:603 start_codon:yes stop_codon:yes gene_type:complete